MLRRAAEGERQAFELVYRKYQQVVYRFARAMTGRPDVAEDVTQEVFVALIKELPRYDSARAGFTTYLYGIARNLSRERWRRAQRRLAFETIRLERRQTADDPLDLIERAQAAAQVRRALRKLPLRYREVIILRLPIRHVSERWYSPELKVVVMSRRIDPRFGEMQFRLTNIVRGEPPAHLFEVPSDFRIQDRKQPPGQPIRRDEGG